MNGVSFRIGDRVLFGRNDRLLGVRNGTLGELQAFNPSRIATVALDGEKRPYVPIDKYRKLNLGYCPPPSTPGYHPVDRTFVRCGAISCNRGTDLYVQASRSRYSDAILPDSRTGWPRLRPSPSAKWSAAWPRMSLSRNSGIQTRDRERRPERSPEISPSLWSPASVSSRRGKECSRDQLGGSGMLAG